MTTSTTTVSGTWEADSGKKGRTQKFTDRTTAMNSLASLAYWHLAENPSDRVAIIIDGERIPLSVPGAPALNGHVQAAPTGDGQPTIQVLEGGHTHSLYVPNGEVPTYIPQKDELDILRAVIAGGLNGLLTGPTGCGKTHAVTEVCRVLGKPLVTIQGNDGAAYEHLVGYRTIEDGKVSWVDGLIPQAMRAGAILYVDEPNALPDGIRFTLFSAMDHRRAITLPENAGEVVIAAEGFTVLASMNEGTGYTGTSLLSHAFRDRFDVVVDFDYLDQRHEAQLLAARTGIEASHAKRMVAVAGGLRTALKDKEVRTPVSTRTLLAWANLMQRGFDGQKAGTLTLVAMVPGSLADERRIFADLVEAHFAGAAKVGSQDA